MSADDVISFPFAGTADPPASAVWSGLPQSAIKLVTLVGLLTLFGCKNPPAEKIVAQREYSVQRAVYVVGEPKKSAPALICSVHWHYSERISNKIAWKYAAISISSANISTMICNAGSNVREAIASYSCECSAVIPKTSSRQPFTYSIDTPPPKPNLS